MQGSCTNVNILWSHSGRFQVSDLAHMFNIHAKITSFHHNTIIISVKAIGDTDAVCNQFAFQSKHILKKIP
jgi:hypothetical protein